MARTYPVYQAKAKLSEVLRQVKRGRSVTISERGTEVARVVPIQPAPDLRSRLERLEREGVMRTAVGSTEEVVPTRRPGALKRFLKSRE